MKRNWVAIAALALLLGAAAPACADGIGKIRTAIEQYLIDKGIIDAAGNFTSISNTRRVDTTSPLSGGGDLSANRTLTFASQTANKVLASATSGGSAVPDFRALVAADVPSLAASKITSGQLAQAQGGTGLNTSAVTNGQLLIGNTTGNAWVQTTLTGTVSQVTVTNGAGTITLSLPQSIATSSSPAFASLKLNGSTSGTVTLSSPAAPTSYTLTFPTTAGTSGQFLQTNGSGTATWATVTSGVSSITGTSNQVVASASTGDVTLSLPQSIATSSTPAFSGLSLAGATAAANKFILGPATSTNNGVADAIVEGADSDFVATAYGTGFAGVFRGRAARGTLASPSAIQSGDPITNITGRGYGATAFSTSARGRIQIQASQNWTDSAHGTNILFAVTPNGSTTLANKWALNQDGSLIGNSGLVIGLSSSSTDPTVAADGGFSRVSAGVWAFGTGAAASAAGTLNLTSVTLTGVLSIGAKASSTGTTTIDATASFWPCDTSSAGFTITLPTAVGVSGRTYYVKKTSNDANTLTIGTTSSQTIDGFTTKTITGQYASFTLISDGSNWHIL